MRKSLVELNASNISRDRKVAAWVKEDCLTDDDEVILYFDHEDNLVKFRMNNCT